MPYYRRMDDSNTIGSTKVEPDKIEAKPGYSSYLGSFVVGTLTKDLVEDEIRGRIKLPRLDVAGDGITPSRAVKEIFSKDFWREAKSAEIWKAAGKDAGVQALAIIPGSILGYLCLAPVVMRLQKKREAPSTPHASIDAQTVSRDVLEARSEARAK